jgi:hypothetical protein
MYRNTKHKTRIKTKVCDGRNDCMVCKEVFQVRTHLDVVFLVMWMFPSSPHNKPWLWAPPFKELKHVSQLVFASSSTSMEKSHNCLRLPAVWDGLSPLKVLYTQVPGINCNCYMSQFHKFSFHKSDHSPGMFLSHCQWVYLHSNYESNIRAVNNALHNAQLLKTCQKTLWGLTAFRNMSNIWTSLTWSYWVGRDLNRLIVMGTKEPFCMQNKGTKELSCKLQKLESDLSENSLGLTLLGTQAIYGPH